MKRKLIISITVLATFIACKYSKYLYIYFVFGKEAWLDLDFLTKVSLINYTQIGVILFVTYLLFKKSPFKILGLDTGFSEGLKWSFIATLPMFIGYALLFGFKFNFSLAILHRDMVLAGFFEEFAYRAFLFGILFHYAGWGFIPAGLVASLYFGAGHLYQADSIGSAIAIFSFTALASAGFAYFYIAWKSLWMVILLHGFMDLAWGMFDVQDNVIGSFWVNVFRFTTLGLAIYFSAKKAKKIGTYSIKNQLWVNKQTL